MNVTLGYGTLDTMLGSRPFRVTGPPVLDEIRTPDGRMTVLGRMAAEVWMRWAQGNDTERDYPPTFDQIRRNLDYQAHWVAVFADPSI